MGSQNVDMGVYGRSLFDVAHRAVPNRVHQFQRRNLRAISMVVGRRDGRSCPGLNGHHLGHYPTTGRSSNA